MKGNYFTKLLTLFALLWAGNMYANNIQVTINSYNSTSNPPKLNVTLSWDNSWHDGTGTFRDAAWVFIKYKDATMTTWATAPVATTGLTTITSIGNNVRFEAIGRNPITTTAVTSDFRGLIIRRAKPNGVAASDPTIAGVYNVSMTFDIPFVFGGMPANPEFKIFALEMVDVPQAAFYAGDGSGIGIKSSFVNQAPKSVINEAQLICVANSIMDTVPATFPKGFNEFYMMKYELSQEGYVEFLNTLTRAEQNIVIGNSAFNVVAGNVTTNMICSQNNIELATSAGGFLAGIVNFVINKRQGIVGQCISINDPVTFSCNINQNGTLNENTDGQCLPVIPLKPNSIIHYLDWAGLSPATELEFEKACRGVAYPVPLEKCWGSIESAYPGPAVADIDLNGPGESNTLNYNGPVGFFDPFDPSIEKYHIFRCGAFAKPATSSRLTSGGSYYGIMDLSNNAFELVVPVSSHVFTNSHGNGIVGDANTWGNIFGYKGLADGYVSVGAVSYQPRLIDISIQNPLTGIRGVIR